MKIILFPKKRVMISILIIFIMFIISYLCLNLKTQETFAVKLSHNSVISTEFKNKISTLTKGEEKIVYLTFDDGPNSAVTPKILDILEKYNAKATFFVIGKNVENNPEIVKRAYEEGHYIANHGYSHNNSNLYKSEESFINEIKKQT